MLIFKFLCTYMYGGCFMNFTLLKFFKYFFYVLLLLKKICLYSMLLIFVQRVMPSIKTVSNVLRREVLYLFDGVRLLEEAVTCTEVQEITYLDENPLS